MILAVLGLCVPASALTVYGRDVVHITGSELRAEHLAAFPSGSRFAFVPVPAGAVPFSVDQPFVLSASAVRGILAEIIDDSFVFIGRGTVIIPRSFASLRSADFVAAVGRVVLSSVADKDVMARLILSAAFPRTFDPSTVKLSVVGGPEELRSGRTAVTFVDSVGRGLSAYRFDMEVYVSLFTAVQDLQSGERLSRESVAERYVPLPGGSARPFLPKYPVDSYETTKAIGAGATIFSHHVRPKAELRRGQRVSIRFVAGGITLTVPGYALESGVCGAPVRVKPLNSEREFRGTLVAAKEVSVEL